MICVSIDHDLFLILFSLHAVLGTDYEFDAGSSVTFQPGDFNTSASEPMCLNISLLIDDAIEGDHSFQLFISSELSEPEITPGANSNATITINDQNSTQCITPQLYTLDNSNVIITIYNLNV